MEQTQQRLHEHFPGRCLIREEKELKGGDRYDRQEVVGLWATMRKLCPGSLNHNLKLWKVRKREGLCWFWDFGFSLVSSCKAFLLSKDP